MRLVFVTNVWNHYQGALGQALADVAGHDQFQMCVWQEQHIERIQMGWSQRPPAYPWLRSLTRAEDRTELVRSVVDADVCLLGASPRWLQFKRVRTGKLTFIASERIWKKPYSALRWLNPREAAGIWRFCSIANRRNVHLLAIGASAAADVRRIGAFGERIWRWGYFADVPQSPPAERPVRPLRVLWAGRMLPWKRVDLILGAVARLRQEPNFGSLDLVGTGPGLADLRRRVTELDIANKVMFHAPQPPEAVRKMMGDADVCVLASDRNEGWGVVANEAMSEGCVLIANKEAGSAELLVEDGVSGFLFDDGSAGQLASILGRLCNDRALLGRVGAEGWRQVRECWSPGVAANRFSVLASGLQQGRIPALRGDGPCCSECSACCGPKRN